MKKFFIAVCLILFSISVSGCALLSEHDNEKTVLITTDPDTGVPVEQTIYKTSDVGSYNQSVKEMVSGVEYNLTSKIQTVVKASNCETLSGESRAWCTAMTLTTVNSIVGSYTAMVPQVIRDMKKPTSGYDVLNNVVDKNTIPLLGAMGLTGWVIEAVSGNLGSTFNVDTAGGDITDSMNDLESHFTGNDFGDGSSINADVMRRTLENMNNPVTTTTVP